MNSSKKSQHEVLFLSEIDWDYLWQRHQIFTTKYAQLGHKVTYVNRPGMRLPKLSDIPYIIKRIFAKASHVESNAMIKIVSPIFIPGNGIFAKLLNKYIFIPKLLKNVKDKTKLILHVYQPTELTFEVINQCPEASVVYDCVQNFEQHPAKTPNTVKLENELIRMSKVFITDSDFLLNKHLEIREAIRVSPGVDFEHFSQTYRGDEHLVQKKALYYGNVRNDLNFSLINELVDKFGINVEIVGTIQEEVKKLIDPRVIVKDKVSYEELPIIIKRSDFLLLPYKVNEFTKAIIPAKFTECLASGKPIIASRLPAFVEHSESLYFFDTLNQDNIRNHTPNKQQSIAKGESWQSKFNMFYDKI